MTDCRSDILTPLVSGLLPSGSLEVLVTTIRHGQKGVQDIVDRAVLNCIHDPSTERESPHKPTHHRNFYSQSSLNSIDTHSSTGSLSEPLPFDSWRAVLYVVDANICLSPVDTDSLSTFTKMTMDSLLDEKQIVDCQTEPWGYLLKLLESDRASEMKQGLNWLCELMTAQRNLLYSSGVSNRKVCPMVFSDQLSSLKVVMSAACTCWSIMSFIRLIVLLQSILPDPPLPHWDSLDTESDPVLCILCNWLKNAQAREVTGEQFTLLIDQVFSHLFSVQTNPVSTTDEKGPVKGKRESVVLQGQTLFETLGVALKWVSLMPKDQRYGDQDIACRMKCA